MAELRKPIHFEATAAASAAGTLTYTITQPCRLRHVRLRFVPGAQGTLQLTPQFVRREEPNNVFRSVSGGNAYFSGDDEVIDLDCDVELQRGDVLQVAYDNTDTVDSHLWMADMTLSFAAGVS